jgi:hypothetical protein
MADSPDLALQTVINLAITAALPAVTVGAYPTPDGAFPFVNFGESTVTDDVDPVKTIEAMAHCWSRAEGPHEVKTMQQTIREALHAQSFLKNGWALSCVREAQANVILDADGVTWHGWQRFRAFASPSS